MNWKRIACILSMTDPKYLPMMGLPLIVVYLAAGPPDLWLIFGGCVAVTVLNTAAVFVNMRADYHADTLNFPDGAHAIEKHIGYGRIKFWIAGCVFLLAAATLTMWVWVSHQVAVLYVLGTLIGINYSVGLRLKRSLFFSRLAIACGPSISFAGGWALRQSLAQLPPVILLLFLGQGLHLLIKDVPDTEGDRRMGVRTLFTAFSSRQLRVLLPLLWSIPYVLASAGAGIGWWGTRYQALWLLYPLGLLVIHATLSCTTQTDRELARELAQVYAMLFILANLILYAPTALTLLLCVFSLVFYFSVLAMHIDRRRQSHGFFVLARFTGRAIARSISPRSGALPETTKCPIKTSSLQN